MFYVGNRAAAETAINVPFCKSNLKQLWLLTAKVPFSVCVVGAGSVGPFQAERYDLGNSFCSVLSLIPMIDPGPLQGSRLFFIFETNFLMISHEMHVVSWEVGGHNVLYIILLSVYLPSSSCFLTYVFYFLFMHYDYI